MLIGNNPVASGSRVPQCPIFFIPRIERNLYTHSADVIPSGLSKLKIHPLTIKKIIYFKKDFWCSSQVKILTQFSPDKTL